MKTKLLLVVGLGLLVAGSQSANAQGRTRTRTMGVGGFGGGAVVGSDGTDPRWRAAAANSYYGTNGFELIYGGVDGINNIFEPTRYLRIVRRTGTPPVPSYNFTVNGIMTDDSRNEAFVFFYGNSVQNRAYTNSETINGFKISEIVSNTVTLVDTNNKSFQLSVGSGFSKQGSNDWRYLPVPTLANYQGASASSSAGDAPEAAGPVSDAMRRLIERRQQELGDANGTTAPAGGDAGAATPTSDTNSSTDSNSTPASSNGDNNQ